MAGNRLSGTRLPGVRRAGTDLVKATTPRAVYYVNPSASQELRIVTEAELAERRREYRVAYAAWAVRQAALAEHDRKVRRFLLGFGAAFGAGLITALAVFGWLAYHAMAATGLGLLAVPVLILAVTGVAVGGHRCITIVQHWH
jgi:hypothetical protein